MAKKGCGVCESVSSPAICTACVNLRLAERYKLLRRLTYERDILRKRLDAELKAKRVADIYHHWRVEHADRRTKLLACLEKAERLFVQNKQRHEKRRSEYETRKRLLDAAATQLHRRKREFLEQFFPDLIRALAVKLTSVLSEVTQNRRRYFRQLIKVFPLTYPQGDLERSKDAQLRVCGACLPIRDDLHSVSFEDLSASLGYMVKLVQLAAGALSAPLLHDSAWALSSSRIWIRTSYLDSRPSSRSEEYPLFLARKGERSKLSYEGAGKAESSVSGFFSLEKPKFLRGNSDASQSESDRDVKQGLKILKRSISCICVYGYNIVLGLPLPSNMSTFESFMELLSILALKKHRLRLNRVVDRTHMRPDESFTRSNFSCYSQDSEALRNQETSRVGISDFFCVPADLKSSMGPRIAESSTDEWDVVDHPILPPPSQAEDVEHWTRAMITDATK